MSGSAKNKKIIIGIIVAAIGVLAAAVITFTAVSSNNREAAMSTDAKGETVVSELNVNDSKNYAKKLFACAVKDVNDTESVVKLLDTMYFEEDAGKYTAQISDSGGVKVLALNLSEKIKKDDEKIFNSNMQKYAQQMLALIPGVEKIQWTYGIKSGDATNEGMTVSLDAKSAAKDLGKDLREYGKSAKSLQKLLERQKQGI